MCTSHRLVKSLRVPLFMREIHKGPQCHAAVRWSSVLSDTDKLMHKSAKEYLCSLDKGCMQKMCADLEKPSNIACEYSLIMVSGHKTTHSIFPRICL